VREAVPKPDIVVVTALLGCRPVSDVLRLFSRAQSCYHARRASSPTEQTEGPMLFMVIERFKDTDMLPIYKRVRDSGRMLPDGLKYVDSWVKPNFARCFQLMECDDLRLFQEWF
jgi:Protein of unknown function (DUF3303)